jgi:hypothetical protein
MRQAILILRQDRVGAAGVSATAKAKKQKTADNKRVNSDDLLNELDSL